MDVGACGQDVVVVVCKVDVAGGAYRWKQRLIYLTA